MGVGPAHHFTSVNGKMRAVLTHSAPYRYAEPCALYRVCTPLGNRWFTAQMASSDTVAFTGDIKKMPWRDRSFWPRSAAVGMLGGLP